MTRHPLRTVLFAGALAVATTLGQGAAHAATPNATPQAAPGLDAVEEHLHAHFEAVGTPGAAYAVVTPDAVERLATWGEDGAGRPVTADTPFLWGSLSKPVTATAVLTLVEDGTLDLDDTVRQHLPDFTLTDDAAAARVTVRHLLEQTSGLPWVADATDSFTARADPYAEAVAVLADVAPVAEPGERHVYSSANYVVLGAVVEAVTGEEFTTALHRLVLDPWQLTDAVTTPAQAHATLPDGHGYAFGQPVGIAPHYDQTGPSYGYLGGTIEDLARFARGHLNEGRLDGAEVLTPESVELAHTGTARISDTHHYGLGWRDDDRNADLGTRTLWHGGGAPGHQATLVLLPEAGYGVVVLHNIYGHFQDSALVRGGLQAARMLAGGQPVDASDGPAYTLTLAGLAAAVLAVATLAGWLGYRVVRPATRPQRRGRAWAGTGCAVLGGAGVAYLAGRWIPGAVGARPELIRLVAPDVGGLLVALTAAGIALAVVGLIGGVVRLARPSRGATGGRAAEPAPA